MGRIQNMDPRSMDHPCGPGPRTTPHFKRQRTQNGRRWASECLSSQSFGFAGRRVIDLSVFISQMQVFVEPICLIPQIGKNS